MYFLRVWSRRGESGPQLPKWNGKFEKKAVFLEKDVRMKDKWEDSKSNAFMTIFFKLYHKPLPMKASMDFDCHIEKQIPSI